MAVVLALVSAMTYGSADFCGGLAAKRSSALAVAGYSQLLGGLVLVASLPLWSDPVPGSDDLLLGAAAGLCGAIALSTFYGALAKGTMSVVAPITAVISAAIPVAAGLGQGERPAALALLGVGMAVPAIGLVSTGEPQIGGPPRRGLDHPVLAAILAGVGFGLFFVVIDGTSESAGVWPLVAARAASAPVLLGLAMARRKLAVASGSHGLIAVAGVLDMTANVLYLLAVRQGLLSVVAVLAALYPVSTVMLARVRLDERFTRLQSIGLGAAAVAVALVAIA